MLSYIAQRAARSAELAATLSLDTPTQFLWGLADPVSGRPIALALRDRLAAPALVEYPTVGHVPHLEVPDEVAAAIARWP